MRTAWEMGVVRHRRPPRRGLRLGLSMVLMLALTGGYGGYRLLDPDRSGCRGEREMLTVAAAPAVTEALTTAAKQWTATGPQVEGRCVGVEVAEYGSAEFVGELGRTWTASPESRPQVWVPESTVWLTLAQAQLGPSNVIPDSSTSLGSSPLVLAVRRGLLKLIGWPQRQFGWEELMATMGGMRGAGGLPGGMRIALGDPATSYAGLVAVLMMLDRDSDGVFSDAELVAGVALSQALGSVVPDTDDVLDASQEAGAAVAAVPVLERDLLTRPDSPFAGIYPTGSGYFADFPYAVLDDGSLAPGDTATAGMFLQYLRAAPGRQALAAAGVRDTGGELPPTFAAAAQPLPRTRPAPSPETLNAMLSDWLNMQRPVNSLTVLDTSGSMALPVPGTAVTRIGLLQQTAVTGLGLLPRGTKMGLWHFDSGVHVAVPFGPIEETADGRTRSQRLVAAAGSLKAQGDTALYDTVLAAYVEMKRHWEPNHNNVVFITTDGKNDVAGGISKGQLLSRLRQLADPNRPIAVVSIAVGPEADAATLAEISRVTGGRSFVERDPAHAVSTLVLAFAGRLR